MDIQTVQNSWSDIKAKIASKWSKFSDAELESFRNNLDKVSAQIQKTYGMAKDQAEKEYNDFKSSLQSVNDSTKADIAPLIQAVKPQTSATHQSDAMISEGGSASLKKAV